MIISILQHKGTPKFNDIENIDDYPFFMKHLEVFPKF